MNRKAVLIVFLGIFALTLSITFATTQYKTVTAQQEFSKSMKKPGPREGTILAGVYAYCTNGDPAGQGYVEIRRYFNNVNDQPITISEGSKLGYCTIDFGFDISNRYIITTVTHPDTPLGVTVSSVSGTEATIFVWHAGNGAAVAGGDIFIVVY